MRKSALSLTSLERHNFINITRGGSNSRQSKSNVNIINIEEIKALALKYVSPRKCLFTASYTNTFNCDAKQKLHAFFRP